MRTNKHNIDDLIEELIRTNKLDELIEKIESEGLNIDSEIEINSTSIDRRLYNIPVNDKQYELSMDWILLQNKKLAVEINFRLKNLKQLKGLNFSNSGIETGITKTGDAKLVFDKIVSTIIKLVNEKKPNYITFQAREEKRQRTFKYMIKQVLRKTGNTYKEISISPLTNDKFDTDEFWLEKI